MYSNPQSQALLERAVEAGVTPCAVAFASGDEEAFATGMIRDNGPQATTGTLFDLASLTKVVATLPSILRLASDAELNLDDRVGKFFSNAGWFQTPSLADATLRQLLSHSSGLPAWRTLFAQMSERRTALAAVLQTPLEQPGQVVYSDLGFMLLGAVVERVAGERLDRFARHNVFEPLGMADTDFGPVSAGDVAATEECGWRGRLLQGEVHDENATVWEGVAGHAGLFGSAADLARYCRAWLELDPRLGREELLLEAISEQAESGEGIRRGLGWQLDSKGCWAGKGARGYGHTGFTGTSIWIEPPASAVEGRVNGAENGGVTGAGSTGVHDRLGAEVRTEAGMAGSFAVLLTNRVHPHRAQRKGIAELRASFHEALRALSARQP